MPQMTIDVADTRNKNCPGKSKLTSPGRLQLADHLVERAGRVVDVGRDGVVRVRVGVMRG